MRQSQLANKILREAPKDEQSPSAILLTRAGYVEKLSAGIYNFLPLGFSVLKKIERVIREEMMALGGQEILMAALTPKENWQKTNRWETFDALYKLKGFDEKDYALAATHEEIIVPLAQKLILSYKDLPLYLFQIQTKFRNETRAKSGVLRTREFIMKDLYSFHTNQEQLDDFYEQAKTAYFRIFERLGIAKQTHLTFASGGTFAKYSHEFQTVTDSGEDVIHICSKCGVAINDEIKNEMPKCPQCGAEDFETKKAVETGNIFKLGTKYSEPFDLKFKDQDGKDKLVILGCYGLGLARIMGAIVEVCRDEKGIIWPEAAAPFRIHLINLTKTDEDSARTLEIYDRLRKTGLEILFDDRDISAGEKFAESDLLGIPFRIVISEKTLAKESVEIKKRSEKDSALVEISQIFGLLK
ncbi:MAG: Prolyl-tRNA synthetase [Parcubacteria group bacterium GW2011_GWA1_42_7]|nr:MAG: Prolyl-tRNA synthetase [Parcubacteria group bacterium GW2011_GWB1_42_6]KKS70236.1 MAG: Prolyl-tRNA synthetase [Parcubacteria group bacterium GW2011_GWA1_42_7]KKS92589.1 MAG: Proline-tRNA ligase [Parcubacteria group bacterium GW2011_GWC1_43_12]